VTGKRRNHGAAFNAEVALAALQADKTQAQLAARFPVHHSQIVVSRPQLVGRTDELFARGAVAGPRTDGKAPQARIGRLDIEHDFCASGQGWRIQQETVLAGYVSEPRRLEGSGLGKPGR
jgi:transposase